MKTGCSILSFLPTTLSTLLLLLFFGCKPPTTAQSPEPPNISLHMATLRGNPEVVRQHIEAGSDLNAKDAYGSTPLTIAITFGKTEIARSLIEAGVDLSTRNNEGSTPLHLAALFGRTEIVEALLDKGADRYIRNYDGATAFDIVAAPFEEDKWLYDKVGMGLAPLGLVLDYEKIKDARPVIREMLRPGKKELKEVHYAPVEKADWKVSTPAEQGLDPSLVAALYLDAAELENLFSLLVIRDGFLVAEGYYNGAGIDRKDTLQSVTKSYVSALTGLALEQGCLSSLDQKMLEFFPEAAGRINDPRKKQITIRDMLKMRAGFPWEETDTAYWAAILTGDYLPLVPTFPLINDPGTTFSYSNLTSHWLGVIVARACGTDLKSFGQQHLFGPLGVEVGNWIRYSDGYYAGMGEIRFTPRDMAKFGLLYLNKGNYGGKQILPTDWVRESLQRYSENVNTSGVTNGSVARYFRDVGYGYQWWSARVGDHYFNYAAGHGGQLIVLLHDLDMILVTTADPFYMEHDANAWRYERGVINLVGKFISSLPVR